MTIIVQTFLFQVQKNYISKIYQKISIIHFAARNLELFPLNFLYCQKTSEKIRTDSTNTVVKSCAA